MKVKGYVELLYIVKNNNRGFKDVFVVKGFVIKLDDSSEFSV